MDEEFKAELRAFMADMKRRLTVLEIKTGIVEPVKVEAVRPREHDKPWPMSSERYIDRIVTHANVGRSMMNGRMAPAPNDGRAWNDGGKR